MKRELQKTLIDRFDMFKRDSSTDRREPFPMFGFECGDGWYDLLYKLCEDIEEVEKAELQAIPIDERAKMELEGHSFGIKAAQVKEKFGGLRFYINGGSEAVYDKIHQAENDSETICEECGSPASIRGKSWVSVRCDKCWEEEQNKKGIKDVDTNIS